MGAVSLVLRHDGAPADATLAARMVAQMAGPSRLDGDRDAVIHDGPLALHATLTAWTPEQVAEQQPARTSSGVQVVLDGHLDDRERLARDLGLTGPLPADATLAAHAVHRWGDDAAQHLVGSFVLLAWDPRGQRLVVTRAAFGARTVHWHHDGRRTVLASRPAALWRAGVPRVPDLEHLADFIHGVPVEHATTPYRDVRLLEHGHRLVLDRRGVREEAWWRYPAPILDLAGAELVRETAALMRRCVADSLRRTGGVGAMMSGGLDSSTVAAMALEQLPPGEWLRGATEVAPEGSAPNHEEDLVRGLAARHPGLDAAFVASDRHLLDGYADFLDLTGHPGLNLMNRPWMEDCVASAATRGARVVLSGEAGNLTFSLTGATDVVPLLRQGRLIAAATTSRDLARRDGGSPVRRFVVEAAPALGARAAWAVHLRRTTGRWRPADHWTQRMPTTSAFRTRTEVVARARARGLEPDRLDIRPRAELWARVLGTGVRTNPHHIFYEDRLGVQVRDPTRDRRLVELMFALPPTAFRVGDQPRGLARAVAAPITTPAIAQRRGRGLQSAGWAAVTRAALPLLREEFARLRADALAAEVFDLDRADRLLDAVADPEPPLSLRNQIERVVGVGVLLRTFTAGHDSAAGP